MKNYLVPIAFMIGILVVMPVLKSVRDSGEQELRDRSTALRAEVELGERALTTFKIDAVQDSILIARLQGEVTALEGEANDAHTETLATLALLESARSNIREDTLSPGLQNLLHIERAVANSYRLELGVANVRITRLDSIVQLAVARADGASLNLWRVTAQRDSALAIIAGHESALDFSLAGLLFQDLPRKAACAGGGATVAAYNRGDVMLGAVIGLVACMAVESLLK